MSCLIFKISLITPYQFNVEAYIIWPTIFFLGPKPHVTDILVIAFFFHFL